jgi:prophage antirepressor-like protein
MEIQEANFGPNVIRFVEVAKDEWWAIAQDVAKALLISDIGHVTRIVDAEHKDILKMDTLGGSQGISILSELGVYEVALRARTELGKNFRKWVFAVIKELREQAGYKPYEVFDYIKDAQIQKEQMAKLKASGAKSKWNYSNVNKWTNELVNREYGTVDLKKGGMAGEMLEYRQVVLRKVTTADCFKREFDADYKVIDFVAAKLKVGA